MAHVFEGQPDARQSADVAHKVSRFRPTYRQLTEGEKTFHDMLKIKADGLATMFEEIKGGRPSREKSLAITKLEEAIMWAVKDLTSND